MKTIAQSTIALATSITALEKAAVANGMTLEQVATAGYLQSMATELSSEAKGVLVSQDTAIPALDRVGALVLLDETHQSKVARIEAAILA